MLRLRCPWCGPRDEPEFRWGGEIPDVRPGPPQAASDAAWAEYLFMRNNPKGVVRERWVHALGCRQWFVVVRDTVTHEIHETRPLTPAPLPGGERGSELDPLSPSREVGGRLDSPLPSGDRGGGEG